jgi:hypothetical protein
LPVKGNTFIVNIFTFCLQLAVGSWQSEGRGRRAEGGGQRAEDGGRRAEGRRRRRARDLMMMVAGGFFLRSLYDDSGWG